MQRFAATAKDGKRGSPHAGARMFPFGYKLMLSYFLLVLLPVIFIGYFSYTTSVRSVRANARTSMEGALLQTRDNVMTKINELQRISDQLYFDQNLQNIIAGHYDILKSYEITTQYVLPQIEATFHVTENPAVLSIYYDNEELPEIYGQSFGDPLSLGNHYEIYHMNKLTNQEWYQRLNLGKNEQAWGQIGNDSQYGNVSLYRNWEDFKNLSVIGFIRITTKLSDLFRALNYSDNDTGIRLFVVDGNNKVIYRANNSQNVPSDWSGESGHELIISEPLPGIGWKLTAMVQLSEIEKSADRVRNVTIVVCLICLVVLSMIGYVITGFFSKRISKLVASLNAFQAGEFHKRIGYSGNDEFALIANAFNDMAQNIEMLIQEVYLTNISKKEAELKALQEQINPHFLYNTLSSISRLAKFGEIDKLHEMVMGLAKFYRLTLNEGKTLIEIDKELQQVMAYIEIQKTKYSNRLQVSFDIDESVRKYSTVKLILQPFVENALEHAWYGDTIAIRVVALMESDSIVFKVIDNGVGMRPDVVAQILDSNRSGMGYGIHNVNERIKLHFGEWFGVRIVSRPGMGTSVVIKIPICSMP